MHRLRFAVTLLTLSASVAFGQALPEIYQAGVGPSRYFVDIELKIDQIECPAWNQCSVRARGAFQGTPVGLTVSIAESSSGRLKITYGSLGDESNRLAAVLSTLYQHPIREPRFRKQAIGDVVVLQATETKMSNKVFFHPDGPESQYAELYTNIDKEKGVVQIREKDESYRNNVLQALIE